MSEEKIDRIRNHEKLQTEDIDAVLITKPENVLYVLGFKVESDVIIILPIKDSELLDGKVQVYLNVLEYDQAKFLIEQDKSSADIFEVQQIPPGKPNFIKRSIKRMKLNTLGFEDSFISVKRFNEWKTKFNIPNMVGVSEVIDDARLIKTQGEIEQIKKAAELGDIGFQAIYDNIEVGMTEKELAALAEYEMRKKGSEGTSFDTIIASGERSAYPHAKTTNQKVADGDLIIVDIGAKYEGYCSDMTRSFIFGTQTEEKKELINFVNNGQQYTLDNTKAGVQCKDLDKLCRDYFIKQHPFWGERFIHSLGHGVGIDIHENPYLSPISPFTLKENMVVTIEPGIYIQGLGGARTEDLIVIKKEGYDCLSQSKKISY